MPTEPAPRALDTEGEPTTLETVLGKLPPGYTILIHRTPDGDWLKVMFRDDMEFKPWEGAWAQPGTDQAAGILDSALDLELRMIAHKTTARS